MLRYAQTLIEGQPLHYATEGTGRPLLLLAPAPFDHRIWAAAIPDLAGHFRVVAPDLPGCGRSHAASTDGQPDGLIRLLAGLMTALQMAPCVIAGASFSGALALGLAARYPERTRALVLVGSPGPQLWPETAQARLARRARAVPGLAALGLRATHRLQARRLAHTMVGDSALAPRLAQQAEATLARPAGRRMLRRMLGHVDDWRFVMRQLGGIHAPALLIWGEHDRLYGLLAAERLRHDIPGARLITMAGAGHMLPVERPIELAAAMRQFLLRRD